MKQFVIIFVVLTLISKLGYSQIGYPKSVVIDGDSLVIITPKQVKDLNMFKVTFDECKQLNLEMQRKEELRKEQLNVKDIIIAKQINQLDIQQERINLAHGTISELSNVISTNNKKINWLKLQRTSLAVLVVGLIVYTVIAH